MFLSGSLFSGQPLQRAGISRGLVLDDDLAHLADLDGQRCAEDGVDRADLVGQRLPGLVGDAFDLQPLVVENDLLGALFRLDVERCGAADALGGEIDAEVEGNVGDARFERLGIAVNVDGVGAVEDRRNRPLGVGRRRRFAYPARGEGETGEGKRQDTEQGNTPGKLGVRRPRRPPCRRC